MKGPFYEDFCSSRIQELAKVKGSKLILSKIKVEVAVVRPGAFTDDGIDASIKYDEDRVKLLRVLATEKMKGNEIFSLKNSARVSSNNLKTYFRNQNPADESKGFW